MKNLSLFQLILLAVFGALGIIGVLVFALAVSVGESNPVGNVEIWGTQSGKAFSEMLVQASESDPNLKGVTYVEKDAATYESEITDALSVGAGPDLFLLRQDYVMQNAGKLAVKIIHYLFL